MLNDKLVETLRKEANVQRGYEINTSDGIRLSSMLTAAADKIESIAEDMERCSNDWEELAEREQRQMFFVDEWTRGLGDGNSYTSTQSNRDGVIAERIILDVDQPNPVEFVYVVREYWDDEPNWGKGPKIDGLDVNEGIITRDPRLAAEWMYVRAKNWTAVEQFKEDQNA